MGLPIVRMDFHYPSLPQGKKEANRARYARFHSPGFTLIEILVVVLILSAVLGMVTLRLTRDDRDLVRDEADRLVLLLQAAREEAILQGGLFAFEMTKEGYRFLRPGEKGKLTPVGDGPLAPRKFEPRMEVRLEIDGQPASERQGMVLDPGGALPGFNVQFLLNQSRWWVLGGQDGKIRSVPTLREK